MPIEIKELHIKATIDSNATGEIQTSDSGEISDDMIDEIVTICTDRVMEIIKEKNER